MFGWNFEINTWSRFWSSSFMERLMFSQDFEVDAWSRFWRWNLIKICVWTCNMTLARWTQPSGPLCLWQCFIYKYLYIYIYYECFIYLHRFGLMGITDFPAMHNTIFGWIYEHIRESLSWSYPFWRRSFAKLDFNCNLNTCSLLERPEKMPLIGFEPPAIINRF